jgi:hypothetical protein
MSSSSPFPSLPVLGAAAPVSTIMRNSSVRSSGNSIAAAAPLLEVDPVAPEPAGCLPSDAKESTPCCSVGRFQLAIVFVLFVSLRALDRVFNKRVNDRMVNYQMTYVNVLWPVGVQIMTYGLCAAWVLWHRYHEKNLEYGIGFFSPFSSIASAHGRYPQWRLALFSFWDQLNAILTSLPSPFIDMTSQSIMSNFVVVWTILISLVYLRTRYSQEHYIACALILLSCVVAVLVQLQTNKPPLGRYALPGCSPPDATECYRIASPAWYVLFLVGTLPAGVSNCYKQKCLKGVDLEVMYASLWSGNWQIMWGLLLFPINWIPLPSPAPHYDPAGLGQYLNQTFQCFVGIAPSNSTGDLACAAPGGSAALWFIIYLLFNVSFNVLLLWLTKRMSATWAIIATVLCLDLTSLLSMSRALMGDEARPVTLEQYVGLIIAAFAMLVYNLKPELDASGRSVEGAHAFESRPPSMVSCAADARASFIGRASQISRRGTTLSRDSDHYSLFERGREATPGGTQILR